jgi:hypothetical protein
MQSLGKTPLSTHYCALTNQIAVNRLAAENLVNIQPLIAQGSQY